MKLKLFIKKKYLGFFLLILFVNIFSNSFLAVSNLLPTYAFDFLINQKDNVLFYYLFGATVVAFLSHFGTRHLFQYLASVYTERFLNDYRFTFVSELQKYNFAKLQKHDAARLHTNITKDLEIAKSYGFMGFFSSFDLFFIILFSFVSFVILNWLLAIMVAGLLAMNIVLVKLLSSYMNKNSAFFAKANEKHFSKIAQLTNAFENFFFLNKLLRLGKMMDASAQVFCEEYLVFQKRLVFVYFFIGLVSILGQFLFLVLATVLAFVQIPIAPIMFTALFSIGSLSANIFGTFGLFFNTLVQIKTGVQVLIKNLPDNYFAKPVVPQQTSKTLVSDVLNNQFTKLELQNVTFAYQGKVVLQNFSYQFEPNKKYLITGPSGCGKSTLLKIIMGCYEDYEGKIMLNHQDVKQLEHQQRTDLISYVEANPYIFASNLEDNISLFANNPQPAHTAAVLQTAVIDFVDHSQPDLAQLNLSTGEKQRISLARSFYQAKPIVLWDEALANLNAQIAKQIESALLNHPNTTFIHVTHHLQTAQLQKYDAIIDLGAVVKNHVTNL